MYSILDYVISHEMNLVAVDTKRRLIEMKKIKENRRQDSGQVSHVDIVPHRKMAGPV